MRSFVFAASIMCGSLLTGVASHGAGPLQTRISSPRATRALDNLVQSLAGPLVAARDELKKHESEVVALEAQLEELSKKQEHRQAPAPKLEEFAEKISRDEFETEQEFEDRRTESIRKAKLSYLVEEEKWKEQRSRQHAANEKQRVHLEAKLLKARETLSEHKSSVDDITERFLERKPSFFCMPDAELTRFNLDELQFPNILIDLVDRSPKQVTQILRTEKDNKVQEINISISHQLKGVLNAADRDVAKKFKEDWEAGRVCFLVVPKIERITATVASRVIEIPAQVITEQVKKEPDYGSYAFHAVLGTLNVLAGNNDPVLNQMAIDEATKALQNTEMRSRIVRDRSTRSVTETAITFYGQLGEVYAMKKSDPDNWTEYRGITFLPSSDRR